MKEKSLSGEMIKELRDKTGVGVSKCKEALVRAEGDMEMAITLDGLFEQVMVLGEARPYLAALVVLEKEQFWSLANTLGLDPEEPTVSHDKRLLKALLERIAERLHGFPGYAQIHRVGIVATPWTVEDGLITPTLKLKRDRILDRYADLVKMLYKGH